MKNSRGNWQWWKQRESWTSLHSKNTWKFWRKGEHRREELDVGPRTQCSGEEMGGCGDLWKNTRTEQFQWGASLRNCEAMPSNFTAAKLSRCPCTWKFILWMLYVETKHKGQLGTTSGHGETKRAQLIGCNETQLRMGPWRWEEAGERTELEKEHQLLRIWGDQTPKWTWEREFKVIVCKSQMTRCPQLIFRLLKDLKYQE